MQTKLNCKILQHLKRTLRKSINIFFKILNKELINILNAKIRENKIKPYLPPSWRQCLKMSLLIIFAYGRKTIITQGLQTNNNPEISVFFFCFFVFTLSPSFILFFYFASFNENENKMQLHIRQMTLFLCTTCKLNTLNTNQLK